jgi:hypothetical protein
MAAPLGEDIGNSDPKGDCYVSSGKLGLLGVADTTTS